jgi:peptidoglycan/xylan/chitin deacetylase (PgdA/CDA1 family)
LTEGLAPFNEVTVQSAIRALKAAVKSVVATDHGFALSRSRKPGCVVLTYHRVGLPTDPFPNLNVADFSAQMEWLSRTCNIIAPEELRARAAWGAPSRPNVLVTFDDGYRNYFDHAYPVLKRFGIRALNFLCTGFNDDTKLMGWWDRLHLAVHRSRVPRVRLPGSHEEFTFDEPGRAAYLRAAKDYIKQQPERDKEQIVQSILASLDVNGDSLLMQRQTMNWDEVRAAAEFTVFGGHTHSHSIVSRLDLEALDGEVRTCRDRIAAETGTTPDMFAYPNGRTIDFTDEARATLQRHGFHTAFSSIEGLNDAETDWMAVRRLSAGNSVADLAWRLSRLLL